MATPDEGVKTSGHPCQSVPQDHPLSLGKTKLSCESAVKSLHFLPSFPGCCFLYTSDLKEPFISLGAAPSSPNANQLAFTTFCTSKTHFIWGTASTFTKIHLLSLLQLAAMSQMCRLFCR